MLKAISDYSENEKLLLVLQGCDYATYEANDDIKKFNRYQNNQIDGFSERTLQDMEILVMLKDLGFPMHELGTYLYKDLISTLYFFKNSFLLIPLIFLKPSIKA